MIALAKKNMSFIVILGGVVLAVAVSLDGMVNSSKYKAPDVPGFQVPKILLTSTGKAPMFFPPIKTAVLLGEKIPVKTQASPLPQPPTPRLRRLKVRAIMIEGDKKVANINGVIVSAGDYLSGRTILKIEKDKVWVSGPDGKKTISIQD